MNAISPLEGIRQGMPVHDPAGGLIGYVRDLSGRALLIIEAAGPRVFWIDGDKIDRVDGGTVRLQTNVQPVF